MTETPDHRNTAAEWDERYGGAPQLFSGRPNFALVTEVGERAPGRALDVGCGEGADAVWLAERGWKVTALDVSGVALARAEQLARQEKVQVEWVHAGLADAELPAGGFDLVSVQYPALPSSPGRDAERALLAAVAPGGLLLVVFHAGFDTETAKAHGIDPADYVWLDDVLALLIDDWHVTIDENRVRQVPAGPEGQHTHDVVLRAQRLL
ncbi:methyltransferase domain-containing protein [Aldersonia sp. NBC_00410]|uniref:methyltransferase domain-containing protein n=1 Tax=Aldersonia sp. NBC_00410 TaxID=2975954 RepID=UPI002252C43A|nr:methyltransferase domain-containing protein [Aldersonia sp. NBC_00410]MCX5044603.1 methyltransferase domain-containing protein [Aldersonia sp. NBC_00410]